MFERRPITTDPLFAAELLLKTANVPENVGTFELSLVHTGSQIYPK